MEVWDQLEENTELKVEEVGKINETVLIFDGNNMAHKNLFSSVHFNPEDNNKFFLWRHQMLNDLIDKIKTFKPTKVVLVFDEKGSWRYGVYDRYKENRKAYKEKSEVDFDKFYPVFNEFRDDMKDLFSNMYVINLPKCEGDDIIAVLTKDVFVKKGYDVIIVSSDKDLNQLLVYDGVKQYDPMKRSFTECINPEQALELKILTGDKSDSIPSIKKRFGIVSAQKVLDEGLDDFLNNPENAEVKKNYIRNKTLISFEFIPKEIRELIINTYENYEIKEIDTRKLTKFFGKNRLMQLMARWSEYSPYLKSLR